MVYQSNSKVERKKLVLFRVGASPASNETEIEEMLKNALPKEQRAYAKVFYCQGGVDYAGNVIR